MSTFARFCALTCLWLSVFALPLLAQTTTVTDDLSGELSPIAERTADKADVETTAKSNVPPMEQADEIQFLRQRLEILEKAEQKRAEAESKKSADEQALKAAEAAKNHDWIDLSSEKWNVKLGGHIQLDYVNWANTDPAIEGAQDYIAYRRLRLIADGTGYGVFDFRLQMTLEPGSTAGLTPGTGLSPSVRDAYLSMNEIPWLGRVRVGNFFVPFGLEQVTNDTNNMFMERAIPTQGIFCGDREIGIAAYNCTEDKSLSWATGVFFDNISDVQKDRQDSNQGVRISGRLNWVPFYDEPSGGRYALHTGIGILHTQDHDDRVQFSARPQVNIGPRLIDSGVLASDHYTTGNMEFATVMGPVTLQSEGYLCNIHMLTGDTEWIHGAYAHLSWFLTGEHRIYERFGQHGAQFGRNAPFSNLFATPAGWSLGAWEAKARWSYLNLNSVDSGVYNDMTFGCNWYWSDRIRVVFDWIHPITSRDTAFGSTQSDLLAMRLDFNW